MSSADALLSDDDLRYLLASIDVAARARAKGNHPFGALLVTEDGVVLEGENTVITEKDPTGHAETNIVRIAGRELTEAQLAGSTMYASTEPCAMCAGATYWSGIGRLVFALAGTDLAAIVPADSADQTIKMPAREVLARGQRPVEVVGPVALQEARDVHADFWH
ncbi:MAG: cytidine deaminase [Microbacteriaceae bacterium]|jgi:tRNA(Arg) A34 adenosine deaminase TadA|nr:cytidine deaminase [Microbacteriaceae bacterium]